jgi:hypothetical protein
MDWDWDVGEVDLAARNRRLPPEELGRLAPQHWEGYKAKDRRSMSRRERHAMVLLGGRVHPLDPDLRRFGLMFQVHAPSMRDTAGLARGIERARQRIREGKLTPPPPEVVARSERPGSSLREEILAR